MSVIPSQASPNALGADIKEHRKFVRVVNGDVGGFVQFEFAIGWPDLSVELTLSRDQFDEFCKQHNVEFLTEKADPGLGH